MKANVGTNQVAQAVLQGAIKLSLNGQSSVVGFAEVEPDGRVSVAGRAEGAARKVDVEEAVVDGHTTAGILREAEAVRHLHGATAEVDGGLKVVDGGLAVAGLHVQRQLLRAGLTANDIVDEPLTALIVANVRPERQNVVGRKLPVIGKGEAYAPLIACWRQYLDIEAGAGQSAAIDDRREAEFVEPQCCGGEEPFEAAGGQLKRFRIERWDQRGAGLDLRVKGDAQQATVFGQVNVDFARKRSVKCKEITQGLAQGRLCGEAQLGCLQVELPPAGSIRGKFPARDQIGLRRKGWIGNGQCADAISTDSKAGRFTFVCEAKVDAHVHWLWTLVGEDVFGQVGGQVCEGHVTEAGSQAEVSARFEVCAQHHAARGKARTNLKQAIDRHLRPLGFGEEGQSSLVDHDPFAGLKVIELDVAAGDLELLKPAENATTVAQGGAQLVHRGEVGVCLGRQSGLQCRYIALLRVRGRTGNAGQLHCLFLLSPGRDGKGEVALRVTFCRKTKVIDGQLGQAQTAEQHIGQRNRNGDFANIQWLFHRPARGLDICQQQARAALARLQGDAGFPNGNSAVAQLPGGVLLDPRGEEIGVHGVAGGTFKYKGEPHRSRDNQEQDKSQKSHKPIHCALST